MNYVPVRGSGLSGYVTDATRGNVQLTADEAKEVAYEKEMEERANYKPKELTRGEKRVKYWEHVGVDLAEFVAGLTLSEMLMNPGALTEAMYYIGSGAMPDAWFATNAETVENMYKASNIIIKTNRLRGVEGMDEENQVRELAKARSMLLARRDAARNYLNLQDIQFTRPFQQADAAMGGNYKRLMGRMDVEKDAEMGRLYGNRMSEYEKAHEEYLRNKAAGIQSGGDSWYSRGLRYTSDRADAISNQFDSAVTGIRSNVDNVRQIIDDVRTGTRNLASARIPSFSSQVPAFSGVNLPRGLTSYALRGDYALPSLRGAARNVEEAVSRLSLPLKGSDIKDTEMIGYPSRYSAFDKESAAKRIQRGYKSKRLRRAYDDIRSEYRNRGVNVKRGVDDMEQEVKESRSKYIKKEPVVDVKSNEAYSKVLDNATGVDDVKNVRSARYHKRSGAVRKLGVKKHSGWRDSKVLDRSRTSGATKLQSWYRGVVARSGYNKKRKATVSVQSLYRRNKARTSYLDALNAGREESYSPWVRRQPRRSVGIWNRAWNYERRAWDPNRRKATFPSPPYGYGGM